MRKFILALSITLAAAWLAFVLPNVNQEQDRQEALSKEITQILVETRGNFSNAKDYRGLGKGYYRAGANPWGEFFVAASADGFRIRLTRIPDSTCRFLLAFFSEASPMVIEDSDDIVLWSSKTWNFRRSGGKKDCIGDPNEVLNGVELLFKR